MSAPSPASGAAYAATLADVRAARERIAPFIRRTPLHTSRQLDERAGIEVFLKCEIFQRTGSFKARGATNAVRKLDDAAAARGVVTHSSGNHAQALAWAAASRGIASHVVMPTNAPATKRAAVIAYGGRVVDCEPTLQARESTAAAVVAETGGTLIPPFDHPDVIAGQGTMALELVEDIADLDAVVVPVGGGGMITGITLALRELAPRVRVIGAEPLAADDAARSKAAGERILQTDPRTVADGLRTSLGALTWPVVRDLVSSISTPTEDEIVAAMRFVFERVKLVIEPSAAVGVAVVLGDALRKDPTLRKVAVILCGGNVDLDRLPWPR